MTVDANAAFMSAWIDPSDAATNNVQLPSPRPNAGRQAAWLYTEFVDDASPTAVGRTAMQLALWNVLYDVDFTLTDSPGTIFSVEVDDINAGNDALLIAQANQWLEALGLPQNQVAANLADATWLQVRACAEPGCQDIQDVIGPLQAPTPVPEPASALLLTSAIGGLAAARRRRKS